MNEKNLIAVSVGQDGQVWEGHYGVSPQYYLFDRAGNLVGKRSNPYIAEDQPSRHHGKPELIAALLPDCDVFIGRQMGKPEKLIKLGVQAFITEEHDPKIAVANYIAGA